MSQEEEEYRNTARGRKELGLKKTKTIKPKKKPSRKLKWPGSKKDKE